MPQGRILYLDAYDSFSNNIVALLKDNLPITVEVIRIDDLRFVFNDDAFLNFLNKFDAVVAGPGPGHPANAQDVGLIGKLWNLPHDQLLPVLGICLGFQSLALAFGATVDRLREPRHGLVRKVAHCQDHIFAGLGELEATQYHSLHVSLGHDSSYAGDEIWSPSSTCSDLVPLAWNLEDISNGPILMGLRHSSKPLMGLQFHPESICSTKGRELITTWWTEVNDWCCSNGRDSLESPRDSGRASFDSAVDHSTPEPHRKVHWREVAIDTTQVTRLVDALKDDGKCEPILLESGCRNGKPVNPETGRFSIIGLQEISSLQVRWSAQDQILTVGPGNVKVEGRKATINEVYGTLEALTADYRANHGLSDVPFWGGFVGFLSYEAGLQTIDVQATTSSSSDIWFVLVERSVVVDHQANTAYVQTVRLNDGVWLAEASSRLITTIAATTTAKDTTTHKDTGSIVSGPEELEYCWKVGKCQEHLRAGESYELCLTDQTLVENSTPSWPLYQQLRRANPAPFGAYIRLQSGEHSGISILSSSPERFLSWTRDGVCQFRPIKGTVKKTPDMTRAKAEEVLSSEKERAENLMIVDLIRHDLHGVDGYAQPLNN
jgi:para-aminobenzoate synthetase